MIGCVLNCPKVRKEIGVNLNKEHWYELVPKWVKTSHKSKVTILSNQTFNIQKKKFYDKSDDIICDNANRDVSINSPCNFRKMISDQEAGRIFEHKRTYNENTERLECGNESDTIIKGAVVTVSKPFRKCLNIVRRWNDIKELHKTAILGICEHSSKSTNVNFKVFIMENNITFNMQCNQWTDQHFIGLN